MDKKLELLKILNSLNSEEQYSITMMAFGKVCALLRKEIMPSMDWILEENERLSIIVGGSDRDPNGYEWMLYFLTKALEDYENEKND